MAITSYPFSHDLMTDEIVYNGRPLPSYLQEEVARMERTGAPRSVIERTIVEEIYRREAGERIARGLMGNALRGGYLTSQPPVPPPAAQAAKHPKELLCLL